MGHSAVYVYISDSYFVKFSVTYPPRFQPKKKTLKSIIGSRLPVVVSSAVAKLSKLHVIVNIYVAHSIGYSKGSSITVKYPTGQMDLQKSPTAVTAIHLP